MSHTSGLIKNANPPLDIKNNIAKQFSDPKTGMGYTMYTNAKAKRNDMLTDWILGKQILYIACHGAITGIPIPGGFGHVRDAKFIGLAVLGGNNIVDTDLSAPGMNMNCRLVMLDACYSMETGDGNDKTAAQNDDVPFEYNQTFAAAFGPNASVLGWGFDNLAGPAQTYFKNFIPHLSGVGQTVKQALTDFRTANSGGDKDALLLKLWQNGKDAIVDLRNNPGDATWQS
jgi:hypothetical protein